MKVTLKAMSLGEILDTAIQMMRTNLTVFAGIALIPAIVNLGNQASRDWLATYRHSEMAGIYNGIAAVLALVFSVAMLILNPLATGAKCRAAAQIMWGEPVTARSAYGAFRYRTGRMIGLTILQSLYSYWPLIIGLVALAAAPNAVGAVLFAVSLACCGFFVARYALAFPATAIMDSTATDSLRRSDELGRGFRWKVLWAYALPAGIVLALNLGGVELFAWLKPASALGIASFLWESMGDLWIFLVNIIFGPVASIAVTLAYYDLCVRKEGLDIEQMMAQAGMASAQGPIAQGATAAEGILGLSAPSGPAIEGPPQVGSGESA